MFFICPLKFGSNPLYRRGINDYSIHGLPECLSLRRNWVPHPFPRKRVCLVVYHNGPKGGSNTRLRVRGWGGGGTRIGRQDRKPGTLNTLCPLSSHVFLLALCSRHKLTGEGGRLELNKTTAKQAWATFNMFLDRMKCKKHDVIKCFPSMIS
jgi:hypothetical protein